MSTGQHVLVRQAAGRRNNTHACSWYPFPTGQPRAHACRPTTEGTHSLTCTHPFTDKHAQHTHACTHTYTHTHTCTQHKHTQTHMHTHTHLFTASFPNRKVMPMLAMSPRTAVASPPLLLLPSTPRVFLLPACCCFSCCWASARVHVCIRVCEHVCWRELCVNVGARKCEGGDRDYCSSCCTRMYVKNM